MIQDRGTAIPISRAEAAKKVYTEFRGGREVTRASAVSAVTSAPRVEPELRSQPERSEPEPARDPGRHPGRDRLELSEKGLEAAREAREAREADERRVERHEREHRVRGEMRVALSEEKPPYRGRVRAAEAHRELRQIREADERDRSDQVRARHAARRAYREVAAMRPENGLLG